MKNTKLWAGEIVRAIDYANFAHTENAKTPRDMIRFHDECTPYLVHPLWCAATLLQEAMLPLHLRQLGYLVLLWHDILEDCTVKLPHDIPPEIEQMVKQMTFASFTDEVENLWDRPIEIKLFKLYDKVSNLMDAKLSVEKWNRYVDHTLRLSREVCLKYGKLNIVKFAEVIAVRRKQ